MHSGRYVLLTTKMARRRASGFEEAARERHLAKVSALRTSIATKPLPTILMKPASAGLGDEGRASIAAAMRLLRSSSSTTA